MAGEEEDLAPEEDLALEEDLACWQGRRRCLVWEHRLCNEPPGSAVAQPRVAAPGRGLCPPWSSVASSVKWGNRVTSSQDF